MKKFFLKLNCFLKALLTAWIAFPIVGCLIGIIWSAFEPPEWQTQTALIFLVIICLFSPVGLYKYFLNKASLDTSSRRRTGKQKRSTNRRVQKKRKSAYKKDYTDYENGYSISEGTGSFTHGIKGASPLKWKGRGTRIKSNKYLISDPLTYYSKDYPLVDEPSCINLKLPIGKPVIEPPGALGYWPHYGQITKDQRANYLRWMAEGRTDNLEDIGYAFIFFYGLERRAIVENKDINLIVNEIVSLLRKLPFSNSFNNYLSNFVAYIIAKVGVQNIDERTFNSIFDNALKIKSDDCLSVVLAWFAVNRKPLPVQWAKTVAYFDQRSPRSVVLKRTPQKFDDLFSKKYEEMFGEGIVLKTSKRHKTIGYHPASSALKGYTLFPYNIPNARGIQGQFTPLVKIWTQAIEELRKFSRVIGKGLEKNSRHAYEALPDELKGQTEHPDAPRWEKTFSEYMRDDGHVLVKTAQIAEIQGYVYRDKLTLKQSKDLAKTAHYVGLGIEPDPRITNASYKWHDLVALFRPDEDPELPKDSTYRGASIILELGMAIAAADGVIEDEEVDYISKFLEGQFMLGGPDANRLHALRGVFVENPPSLTGISRRLRKVLSEGQREKVGEFLVGVAAANGEIDKAEVKALRRAYKALEVPNARLDDILGLIRTDLSEPVEVTRAETPARKGEAIPTIEPGEEVGIAVRLDETKIRNILIQTREVAAMLGKAMGEVTEEEPEETTERKTSKPTIDARFEGLDPRYHGFLAKLLNTESWGEEMFESLVREHKLMPSATIEVINEWADTTLGDLMIEEGDPLIINNRLIKENDG